MVRFKPIGFNKNLHKLDRGKITGSPGLRPGTLPTLNRLLLRAGQEQEPERRAAVPAVLWECGSCHMAALWDHQICDVEKDAPRKENGSSDIEITISDY